MSERRTSRRAALAVALALLWLAGMAALVRRELFRGETERMAQAALLIAPGAEYYAVTKDSARIGYASSTLDTSATGIHLSEVLVAESPEKAGVRRRAARSLVNLTRGMKRVNFQFELGESYAPYKVFGRVVSDTALEVIVTAGSAAIHARYFWRPAATGSASSSGTLYGCSSPNATSSASMREACVLSRMTTSCSSATFPSHR